MESISWNEDMVVKLNGAINQLGDIEEEKTRNIKKSFRRIKDETRSAMIEKIPQILRGSSDFVTEDSNFSNLHDEINDEMNKRIKEYIDSTVLPEFHESLENWIQFS
ncbi:MAG TPA: GTP-binding protein, partial [Bacillus bacterium]|nr:GTP-binding protein [Bacillus sp. (in: firmicutes)]